MKLLSSVLFPVFVAGNVVILLGAAVADLFRKK